MKRGSPLRFLPHALVLLAAFSVGVMTTGFAAGLPVTSRKLTVVSSAASAAPQTCVIPAATKDAYIDQATPTTANGGGDLLVRSEKSGKNEKNQRALVAFSFSSCTDLTSTSDVTSARLKLFMFSPPSSDRTYDVHRVTADWSESTATWTSTAAAFNSTSSASTTTGTTAGTLAWNVAADVEQFLAGGASNYGWMVKDQSESLASGWRQSSFRSREHTTAAQRPTLEIVYYP